MPKLKLTIAYVGTLYSGWQVQAYKDRRPPKTIQALLEEQLSRICGKRTAIMGSGRTDAGVHADCQVAHCYIPDHREHMNWQLALNTSLPPDIRIIEACIVSDDFHAHHDVLRKEYTYSLWLNRNYTPPKLYPFVWACGHLDIQKLDEAIPHLLGNHDFKSMQNSGTAIKSTTRTLIRIHRSPYPADNKNFALNLRFEASGFLKQMVRNLTGLLVACGQGKFSPHDIPQLLHERNRQKAPPTAPAKGLCMSNIWYKNEA